MSLPRRTILKITRNRQKTSIPIVPSSTAALKLEWEPIAPLGPKAAFHVGGVINNVLYIHGGIQDIESNEPSNQFFRLDLKTLFWEEIHTTGSPSLSHHAAVVLENRYLLLIGGWDGKKRGTELYVYDTQEKCWSQLKQTGFPVGGGLSSHTANTLSDGSIVVIGREGSLRMQRRHGSIYILSGSILSGQFTYKEYTHDVMSRSGHTVCVIRDHIFIIGGRKDCILEKASGFKEPNTDECKVLSQIINFVESKHQTPLQRFPCGRKNHTAVSNHECILVHGGEVFDGRREPIGEMLVISVKTPNCFYKVNGNNLKRAGHVCCALSDRVILHGGLSGKCNIHADLYNLKIRS